MKKLLALFATVALIAGCSQDEMQNESQDTNQSGFTITAEKLKVENTNPTNLSGDFEEVAFDYSISDPSDLRNSIDVDLAGVATIKWNEGDMIGICKTNPNTGQFAAGQKHLFNFIGTQGDVISQGIFEKDFSSGPFVNGDYYAYYPYLGSSILQGKVKFEFPVQVQSGNGTSDNFGKSDFMYSDKLTIGDRNIPSTGIHFHHGVSFLEFNIDFLPVGTILYQIEMKSDAPVFRKSIELDAASGTLSYTNPVKSVSLFTGENGYTVSSEKYTGWLMVAVDPASAGQPVTINLETSNGTYTVSKSFPATTSFKIGTRYRVNLTGGTTFTPDLKAWNGTTTSIPKNILNHNITIYNAEELAWVAGICNRTITAAADKAGVDLAFSGYTITLGSDIYLNDKEWTPISNALARAFKGTFNGNGKVIHGLKIATPAGHNQGLFGFNNGTIKNLEVSNVNMSLLSASSNNVGSIVGNNLGSVLSCKVSGNILIIGKRNIGGIVGFNTLTGTINGCTYIGIGTITGLADFGNIVGLNDGTVI